MDHPLSPQTPNRRGCNECGGGPAYLTPDGLRCRDHIHEDLDWDDWIPLMRKESRRRPVRPNGGSAGSNG